MKTTALSAIPPGISNMGASATPKTFGKSCLVVKLRIFRIQADWRMRVARRFISVKRYGGDKIEFQSPERCNCAKNITYVLTVDEHQLTGRDFKASPRMEHSIGSFHKREN